MKVFLFEPFVSQNMKLIEESTDNGFNFILKADKLIKKNGYVNIASISYKKVWIKESKLKGVKDISAFIDYLLIAISDVIIINKVYNINKAFDKLDFALDLGKSIYAIPGDIEKYNSYFANYTIKQGAGVICNKYDLKNI